MVIVMNLCCHPTMNGMMRTLTCLLAAVLLMPASAVHATVYISADLGELTTEARAIAYGRVIGLEAQWLEGRRSIETLVTIDVETYVKGDLGRTVTLRVPGGQMGPYRSVMLGAPTFVEGEQVVVFLAAAGPAIPHLVGLAQGVFRVRTDVATGARLVTPEIVRMPGAAALEPVRVVRGDASRRPAPLAAFLQEVRALAGRAQ
jgi:hypothetical protein